MELCAGGSSGLEGGRRGQPEFPFLTSSPRLATGQALAQDKALPDKFGGFVHVPGLHAGHGSVLQDALAGVQSKLHFIGQGSLSYLAVRSSAHMKGAAVPDSLRDVVHILGLGDGLDVVLQDAREVVLQLRAPEVGQDLLPVRR